MTQFSLKMHENLLRDARIVAREKGLSLSALIRVTLILAIKNHKKDNDVNYF